MVINMDVLDIMKDIRKNEMMFYDMLPRKIRDYLKENPFSATRAYRFFEYYENRGLSESEIVKMTISHMHMEMKG